jgi:hypothetical protein
VGWRGHALGGEEGGRGGEGGGGRLWREERRGCGHSRKTSMILLCRQVRQRETEAGGYRSGRGESVGESC